jgi:DNA repair protein RecO (recombination protein O)
MRPTNFEGVVLKRQNHKDADKLLVIYTKNHGKLTVLAKGLRKPTSKRASSLELFNHVSGHLVFGRGEIPVLADTKLLNSFSAWRHHLGRVTLAYQLCEAVDKLTPDHESQPAVFSLLLNYLSQISVLGSDWEAKTDVWLLKFLEELGFWPAGKVFAGSVISYIEDITDRSMRSSKLLSRLKYLPTSV